ncbi:hypothetical protein COM88_33715, partial [Bacillus cereus]
MKRSGDVMTGALSFNNTSQKNGIQFQSGGVSKSILGGDATRVNLWDNVNALDVWSYNHSTKQFDVPVATNLVKKAEAFYDYAQPSGDTVNVNGQDLNDVVKTGLYASNTSPNFPRAGYWYIEVVRYSDRKYVKQTATLLTSGAVTEVWVRRMNNNMWDP